MKVTSIHMKRVVAMMLLGVMFLSMFGCSGQIASENLMDHVERNHVNPTDDLQEGNEIMMDFAVDLLSKTQGEQQNVLISPLSVMCAMSMVMNGADGQTLAQMKDVLGASPEVLNLYLHSYATKLPQGDSYKLKLANSIWVNNGEFLTVEEDFLQVNKDYYDADVYKTIFDDEACKDINAWVKEKTDKMIPEILDEIPCDAVMYLVNALAFDGKWDEAYKEHNVYEDIFTTEEGEQQTVEFMSSEESVYLEDEYATGFLKYYKNKTYAFVALLPDEDVSVSEYVETLTGEHLQQLMKNRTTNYIVKAVLPKFQAEYSVELSEMLKTLGMPVAFDADLADFSNMATSERGNIFISRVLHKTFISVNEEGTKAGAATLTEMSDGASMEPQKETKYVTLDRPFVYMLIDCKNQVPFFIGTQMDMKI